MPLRSGALALRRAMPSSLLHLSVLHLSATIRTRPWLVTHLAAASSIPSSSVYISSSSYWSKILQRATSQAGLPAPLRLPVSRSSSHYAASSKSPLAHASTPTYTCASTPSSSLTTTTRSSFPPYSYSLSSPLPRSLHTSTRQQSVWTAAVSVASNAVSDAVRRVTTPKSQLDFARSIDPLRAVAKEMQHLAGNMRRLLGSDHPSLERVAKYYTRSEGKHFRPLLVLLMSQATTLCPKSQTWLATGHGGTAPNTINTPITPFGGLSDVNPSFMPLSAEEGLPAPTTETVPPEMDNTLPSQRRLAEITELIHTASLLHDDVIDHSESRRGSPSANLAFGNKMAVLAGDFLLGRASLALARLRNVEVVELLATAIANLVEGEFMQLKNTMRDEQRPQWSEDTFSYYLQKTYLKSASLIANSCRASAILGGSDMATVDAAYMYGKNLGLSFQLVDDMLDYTRSAAELGKPAGADLRLGLATAPLLFAWKQMPELGALVGRKFEQEGDVEKARELVLKSDGVEQTRHLAETYRDQAVEALHQFPDSEAKYGLIEMANKALKRQA